VVDATWRKIQAYMDAIAAAVILWTLLLLAAHVPDWHAVLQWWLKLDRPLTTLAPYLALAVVCWGLVHAFPRLTRFWRRWLRTPGLDGWIVFFLAGAALMLLYVFLWPLEQFEFWLLSLLAAVLTLICAARFSRFFRSSPPPAPETILHQVLGDGGLAPLQVAGDDELERGPLLSSIEELVCVPQEESLTFGIDGPWGSGKTSLLNLLRNSLERRGHTVVTFDAWQYREPDRLVPAYFDLVEAALRQVLILPWSRRRLKELAAGLAEVGGRRFAGPFQVLLGEREPSSIKTIRAQLQEHLDRLKQPVFVFMDDLDRLSPDELQSILRSIRLLSELPKLTHVLAYDRAQLGSLIDRERGSSGAARDYLGKLVNIEFSIGDPPSGLGLPVTLHGARALAEKCRAGCFRQVPGPLYATSYQCILAGLTYTPRNEARRSSHSVALAEDARTRGPV
jgi:hypothetical protein